MVLHARYFLYERNTLILLIQGPQNQLPYFLAQPPVLASQTPSAALRPPHPLQGPPMAFYPQPPALFSPPPTPPMPVGPQMSLVHAVDLIEEDEYKVVVGREGATLNGIRSCSQVYERWHQTVLHSFFQQASIMIREKKKEGGDLLKTSNPSVVEKNKSLSVEKDGKEKGVDDSPGNGVQYVVTYVGTAQQVESSSQTRSGLI